MKELFIDLMMLQPHGKVYFKTRDVVWTKEMGKEYYNTHIKEYC